MSNMDVSIQWFIARDGRQHGPVSDIEMRKLVELGHLRPTDLLWRQGFPDWRPAPAVFASSPPIAPSPQPYGQSYAERTRTQSPTAMPRFEATSGRGAHSGQNAAAAAAAAAQTYGQPIQPHGPAFGQPQGSQFGAEPRTQPQFIPMEQPRDAGYSDTQAVQAGLDSIDEPKKSGAMRRIAVATIVAAMLGGGAYAVINRDKVRDVLGSKIPSLSKDESASTPKAADEKPAEKATAEAAATQPAPATAVEVATQPAADLTAPIDTELKKAPHWQLIANEFPDWYKEKVAAAAKLPAAEKDKFLVQSMVELRRSNADVALGASSETLKTLASAFKNTVTRFAKDGTPLCMSFIMSGEASDTIAPIVVNPNQNAELNAHLLAVFSAISEGRKSAVQHADPADSDYKVLVAELVKAGWTQSELELFADPKGATRTTPERYCQMMQDFFAAHLSIADPAVQDRLLHRTLKLVVAG